MATDWVTEIAKIGLSGVVTITGVFLGARFAMANADRGRRDDILFKARMEAYNKIGLVYMKYISDMKALRTTLSLSRRIGARGRSELFDKGKFDTLRASLKAFDDELQAVKMGVSLFPGEVMAGFIASSTSHSMRGVLYNISAASRGSREISHEEFVKLLERAIEVIDEYIDVSEKMIDDMNRSLGLSGVQPFYATSRELFMRVDELIPMRDQYGLRIHATRELPPES